ncbi:MAG: hypothetical protein Q9191_005326, partial [Dirinaria sp. TL-2023a]
MASVEDSDDPDSPDEPPVNLYEQLYPGAPDKRRIDLASQGGDEDSEQARLIQAKIEELDSEIADLSGDNKPSLIEPLIATLSEEEQLKVRKALAEAKPSEDSTALLERDVALMDLPKLAKLGTKLGLLPQQT